jgi:carbamoyl-phosphate synthase large subunit
MAGVVVVSAVGFTLLHGWAQRIEAGTAVLLLRAGGADGVWQAGHAIQVVPAAHAPFRAVVTPSCSATASVLALGCLGAVYPRHLRRRRRVAVAAAIATVAGGNVLRIAASVAVGLIAGRGSLVLFHDWVGSAFAFAYVLGGYLLMLYLLLPRDPREELRAAST